MKLTSKSRLPGETVEEYEYSDGETADGILTATHTALHGAGRQALRRQGITRIEIDEYGVTIHRSDRPLLTS